MRYPIIASRGVIVFPKQYAYIGIARAKSLNAMHSAIDNSESKLIIVSQVNPAQSEVKSANDIFKVGTLVQIKIKKETSSHVEIEAKGLERVKIKKCYFNKNLIEGDVEILKTPEPRDKEKSKLVKNIYNRLREMMRKAQNVPFDVTKNFTTQVGINDLPDALAHYLPLDFRKKQKVLEELNFSKRLKLIDGYLMQEKFSSIIEKDIEERVRGTLNSQQREFLLREKLKAIKEELGDISSKGSDVDQWRKMLKDPKFPKEVRKKMEEEIKRYEAMPPISAESHVSKGYIDWVMKLPWKTFSKDTRDLAKAKKILESHHYGLKKVKERIIEHLAVKINTQASTSPIIALVGPPGVGKTSLAKSIAEAVDREFVKVSLGGVRDEAEIRGHRRTYVGALPGKIIQAINKAKTSNPVMLLDEIDKMSADFRGDPTSALLEVLDPEQNKKFQDHFLELEYDLSQVMFIATANYFDNIPLPLKDRVETIFLHQYTSEEKLAIAKKHLIPQILIEHGLKKKHFKISDKMISYLIDRYTLEAGVRNIQKILSKLARKIVLLKIENKIKDSFEITKPKIIELLGKEKIHKKKLEGKAEIGLVNGMYFSPVGGGILPIEVSTYKAKNGGIKVTGQLQDVMQESLKIAIGYLRSKEKDFHIDFDWDNTLIQVHVPEGATQKDGPSAGVAFTTSVLSALLKKPIAKEVALTGEITLRGKILPIGGLKEKTLGAVEAGVKKIFIPKDNSKDIDDLAKKVKDTAQIIMVEDYREVYKSLF